MKKSQIEHPYDEGGISIFQLSEKRVKFCHFLWKNMDFNDEWAQCEFPFLEMNYLLEKCSKFWTNCFGFPIVHQHVNLTIITCWRNEFFLNTFSKCWWFFSILDIKVHFKIKLCLTCRWILQKKSLFRNTFFHISPTCNSFFM